jgi:hypothetical protein
MLTKKQIGKTVRTEDGHLLWRGACANGYPAIKQGTRTVYLNRHLFEELHGPVPAGAVVTSSCGVRACIEPEHLGLGAPGRYPSGARDRTGRYVTAKPERQEEINPSEAPALPVK